MDASTQLTRSETSEYVGLLDGVDPALISPDGESRLQKLYADVARDYEAGDIDAMRQSLSPIRGSIGILYVGRFRGGTGAPEAPSEEARPLTYRGLSVTSADPTPSDLLDRLKALIRSAGGQQDQP